MANYAVIGAGFGDEGKGLMTDYLCRQSSNALNVRFNGGAQAGHTVVTEKDRHVFSHVCSGTYADAHSYLSEDFIFNPVSLMKESDVLKKDTPPIVHPNVRVSTIFDIVLNRFREASRGGNRHGSCGMGINETVSRHLAGFELTISDLANLDQANQKLRNIYEEWFQPHVENLQGYIPKDTFEELIGFASADNETYLFEKANGYYHVPYLPAHEHEPPPENVVFEGAQGLELDEELGVFPHVTRSICGLKGAFKAADELGLEGPVHPVYVTRCYKTRHGAGPLIDEHKTFIEKKLFDKTNSTNDWQGSFRYAPLNLPQLQFYINRDLERVLTSKRHGFPSIALTHLDEIVYDRIMIKDLNHRYVWVTADELIAKLSAIAPVRYVSYGETARDVVTL